MSQSDIDRIRVQVERLLGYEPGEGLLTGPGAVVWAWLVSIGLVEKIARGRSTASEAADFARDKLRRAGVALPSETIDLTPQLKRDNRDPNADLRQEVLSLLFAARAAKTFDVKYFREKRLGGRLLKREAVGAWIRRQADRDGNRPRVFRELEPGSGIRIEIPYLLFTDSCRTGDGLSWKAHRVPVWASDGVLDDLRLVSKRLESEFPWELESATTFVLTGEPPTVSRITGQIKSTRFLRARSRITMTIDPTVTPQEVMESYKRGRDRLLGKRRRYRCIGEKSLRLALFTAEQPENYTHRQQMEKWNKRHPKWRHEEPKVFGRAQRDVMRLLLEPFAIRKAFAADVPASQKEK